MPIEQGKKEINDVLTQPNWDFGRLLWAARNRATQEFKLGPPLPPNAAFGLNACQTHYGITTAGLSQELAAWILSIMLAEYTAGLLAEKVEDGHCQLHRVKPDFKPCLDMANEHMRMLRLFKERLRDLVKEIEKLEQGTQVPQSPAQP